MISLNNILNEIKPIKHDNSIWVYLIYDRFNGDYLQIIKGNLITQDIPWSEMEEEWDNNEGGDEDDDDIYGMSKIVYKTNDGEEIVEYYKDKIKVK